MQSIYRDPQVEEGRRNLILQNRCGNRLTLMMHEGDSQLELVYKPNAQRRRDLAARTFSDRDNFTALFRDLRLPDWGADHYVDFGYDPFCSVLGLAREGGAVNRLTLINIIDENVFALSARQPLLLTVRPRQAFTVSDGLLLEEFSDRGEGIVSFLAFTGMNQNRYRVLDDGTHVLQLVEDDLILIGGEENRTQVTRILRNFQGFDRDALIARNESLLAQDLAAGRQVFSDPVFQRIADLNRRIVWSGLDAGGACFGALNRIYHLVWVRDGSMTSNHLALAGDPTASRIWAPFLLANPSRLRHADGQVREEFVQIVGTRWTKTEDDGLFYATWSAFTHFRTTGDDALLAGPALPLLVRCVEAQLEKCWDERLGLMGSDTLGEDLLAGSAYFGYDMVNGKPTPSHHRRDDRQMQRCYSLYHQLNTVNVLWMMTVMLQQRPEVDAGIAQRYLALAERLLASIADTMRSQEGTLASLYVIYDDGSEELRPWGPGVDFWEHAWAVSQGPFFPLPSLQLASARQVVATWSDFRAYGYCPWNVLMRTLAEHGLPSADYRACLADELAEAQVVSQRYPMPGSLTEYHGDVEGWRGLPFSAGSLLNSTAGQLLQSQAQGLAVRGGTTVDRIDAFRYCLSRIDVVGSGHADGVAAYVLNGESIRGCLQLSEDRLRPGRNTLTVERGAARAACRIHGSNGELLWWREDQTAGTGRFRSAVPLQIRVEGWDAASVLVHDPAGAAVDYAVEPIADTAFTVLQVPAGEWLVSVEWGP